MTWVLDASFLLRLAGAEGDEVADRVRAANALLRVRGEVLAPVLLWYEVAQVLHRSERRRGRPLPECKRLAIQLLRGIEPVAAADGDMDLIGTFVDQYGLTAYDASYLVLAKTHPHGILVTLDKDLLAAALQELGPERAFDLDGLERHLAKPAPPPWRPPAPLK